ncbi:MAG: hypothetical protein JJU02_09040 [Cryomorphaceae bacterium]|nr:hypothetical protein [Cryomorphaceae bacterium]
MAKRILGKRGLVIFFIAIAFAYGFSIRVFKIFPYKILEKLYFVTTYSQRYSVDSVFVDIDGISELMRISSVEEIPKYRNQLGEIIFKNDLSETIFPSEFISVDGFEYHKKEGFQYFVLIHIMVFGIESKAHLILPKQESFQMLIFHMGHDDSFVNHFSIYQPFLEAGFGLMLFDMPLEGVNNQPIVFKEGVGDFQLDEHDKLVILENDSTPHYLNIFVEPVLAGMNFVSSMFGVKEFSMLGLSGGGWTTQIIAALDERVKFSFPVAASVPLFLRMPFAENMGDYEQTHPSIIQHLGYLDIYAMGAFQGFQKQYFNYYDPCCFGGDLMLSYEPIIQELIGEEGVFEVSIDYTSFRHEISEDVLEDVLNILSQN